MSEYFIACKKFVFIDIMDTANICQDWAREALSCIAEHIFLTAEPHKTSL